jgi:predicted Fe-Mo cluster-binding NifX family protein
MKLAISSLGDNLEAQVDPRFGRCQFIIIYDTETNNYEAIKNPNIMAAGGAGIQTAQFVADKNVEILITGHLGPNAFRTLEAANIKLFSVQQSSVKEAIDKYNGNQLSPIENQTVAGHYGMRNL